MHRYHHDLASPQNGSDRLHSARYQTSQTGRRGETQDAAYLESSFFYRRDFETGFSKKAQGRDEVLRFLGGRDDEAIYGYSIDR